MLEACGFERLPGATSRHWGSERPAEGFLLDLTGVGVEAWIAAIMAGRRPPRRLGPDELECALRAALLLWHDDARLAVSRTTVYRLLKRGLQGLSAALGQA